MDRFGNEYRSLTEKEKREYIPILKNICSYKPYVNAIYVLIGLLGMMIYMYFNINLSKIYLITNTILFLFMIFSISIKPIHYINRVKKCLKNETYKVVHLDVNELVHFNSVYSKIYSETNYISVITEDNKLIHYNINIDTYNKIIKKLNGKILDSIDIIMLDPMDIKFNVEGDVTIIEQKEFICIIDSINYK